MAYTVMQYSCEQVKVSLENLPQGEILSHLAAFLARGFYLPDFTERNILKADDGSYRLIDFEYVEDRDCTWTFDFRNLGEYDPYDVSMGCNILWHVASDLLFWNPNSVWVRQWLMSRGGHPAHARGH
ncbi:hypothetical protein QCA50_019802 [Cerrena zonata]|uniref:Uncharacterized protein n=1 Tax=Cerrena zonata TaxID=2478898 RepID=A0AAW0FHX6_9APHY